MPLMVPLVPTGMKTGVATGPCGRCMVAARALRHRACTWKHRAGDRGEKTGGVPSGTRGGSCDDSPSCSAHTRGVLRPCCPSSLPVIVCSPQHHPRTAAVARRPPPPCSGRANVQAEPFITYQRTQL